MCMEMTCEIIKTCLIDFWTSMNINADVVFYPKASSVGEMRPAELEDASHRQGYSSVTRPLQNVVQEILINREKDRVSQAFEMAEMGVRVELEDIPLEVGLDHPGSSSDWGVEIKRHWRTSACVVQ